MSIIVNYNNWIIIPPNDPAYESAKEYLTIKEKEVIQNKKYDPVLQRMVKQSGTRNVTKYLYEVKQPHKNVYIPYGLYPYIKHLFKNSQLEYRTDFDSPLYNVQNILDNIENYRGILSGIELYDNQLEAIYLIFQKKRGIIQAPTGFGKTEIMCATAEIMKQLNDNKYPTILVLEPTIELLNGIKKRFRGYKIPVNDYRETRTIMSNKINIAHPKSLINDLKSNKKLLNKVEVQFFDEAHHSQSLTWSEPSHHMPLLKYSIGLSATFISHYNVNGQTIYEFSYDELKRIGTCGPIILKIEASDLIEDEQLAKPKLVIMANKADEEIDEMKIDYNWHSVRKIRLQSENRTKLIAETAAMFAKYDRKVIILMNILDWGREIMVQIANLGYRKIVRTCFGGQKYEKVNKKGRVEKEFNNALTLFDKEKVKIIVGSSCIQEGIDLSKVDVCILAQGGVSDRTTLQSVGRALRRSKTGKYAYLIDFNDKEDRILNNQYRERMIKYEKVLGINKKDIVKNANVQILEQKFREWENIND